MFHRGFLWQWQYFPASWRILIRFSVISIHYYSVKEMWQRIYRRLIGKMQCFISVECVKFTEMLLHFVLFLATYFLANIFHFICECPIKVEGCAVSYKTTLLKSNNTVRCCCSSNRMPNKNHLKKMRICLLEPFNLTISNPFKNRWHELSRVRQFAMLKCLSRDFNTQQ